MPRKLDPYALADSSAEFRRLNPHLVGPQSRQDARGIAPDPKAPQDSQPKVKALKKARQMNKTEHSFACLLAAKVARGEVVYFRYEGAKLLVGEMSYYCPDFLVIRKGNERPLFVETKGPFVREDSVAKWKAAKEIHGEWCDLEMWQRTKENGWQQIR